MASAAVTITSEQTCVFCCTQFAELIDPTVLPCGDVGCADCIRKLCAAHKNTVECRNCPVVHENLDIAELEKAVMVEVAEAPKKFPELFCDKRKCKGKVAVCFCTDCGEKYCDIHKETHSAHTEDDHNVIHIEDYNKSPAKYKKVFCEQHKKEVPVKACRLCCRIVCNECDRMEGACKGYANKHDYDSLKVVAEEFTAQVKVLLDSAVEKKTDLRKADKKSMKELEDVEKVCREWMKQVETLRDAQIQQLTEAYETVLGEIRDYKEEMTSRALSYSTELINKEEQLEDSRTKVHEVMRDGHMTDKIRRKQQLTDELSAHVNADLGSCELPRNMALVVSNKVNNPCADFIKLPSALTFSSEHSTGSRCYSACHREDGNVLVGCTDGVRLLNKDSIEVTKYDLPYKTVESVIEHRQAVYILHWSKNNYKVEMCLPDLQHSQTFLQLGHPGKYTRGMAVSDRYIVVYNPVEGSRSVVVYNRLTKQTTTTQVTTPHYPYFLPGGELLTAGGGQLIKYKIEEGKITPIWTCKGLNNVNRACTDQRGIIYASTHSNQKSIYIISPSGEKLQELTHDKLPAAEAGQISIRGNQLAVPGWRDNKLYLFNIDN